MLSAKKFASNIAKIRTTDEAFRQLVAESLAFAIFHARNHGQKTPFLQLVEAAPGWLKKPLNSVPLGKVAAKNAISEANAEHEADFRVSEWFASHEEQKAIRAANRKAKAPAAPKVETVEPETAETTGELDTIDADVVEVQGDDALVIGGVVVELTDGEAEALLDTLKAMRHALKLAA